MAGLRTRTLQTGSTWRTPHEQSWYAKRKSKRLATWRRISLLRNLLRIPSHHHHRHGFVNDPEQRQRVRSCQIPVIGWKQDSLRSQCCSSFPPAHLHDTRGSQAVKVLDSNRDVPKFPPGCQAVSCAMLGTQSVNISYNASHPLATTLQVNLETDILAFCARERKMSLQCLPSHAGNFTQKYMWLKSCFTCSFSVTAITSPSCYVFCVPGYVNVPGTKKWQVSKRS